MTAQKPTKRGLQASLPECLISAPYIHCCIHRQGRLAPLKEKRPLLSVQKDMSTVHASAFSNSHRICHCPIGTSTEVLPFFQYQYFTPPLVSLVFVGSAQAYSSAASFVKTKSRVRWHRPVLLEAGVKSVNPLASVGSGTPEDGQVCSVLSFKPMQQIKCFANHVFTNPKQSC